MKSKENTHFARLYFSLQLQYTATMASEKIALRKFMGWR